MKGLLPVLSLVALLDGRVAHADDVSSIDFFEKKIRPVLVEKCYSCHSEESKKAKGGLTLDTQASLAKGGESGPALNRDNPNDSLLLKAIRYDGEVQMPPKEKLPDSVVQDFAKWVTMGAPDPRDGKKITSISVDWSEARKFWSFQRVSDPPIPTVKSRNRIASPVDAFVLAKLEERGLTPVLEADRRTLLRRVTFDLTGLPPNPEEIESFLSDVSPNAFAKVVDRLLESKQYGEHQARYWLDVARYAEDQAHTFAVVPNTSAFRYRDWVIDAFNADMPFDRFAKLQIAADLMETSDADRFHRAALGFFGLGAQYYKNTDAAKANAEELDDRIDTVTRGFLGLTVSCARCHDHKFDPIPTQDYYSIAGVFASSKLANLPLAPKEEIDRFDAAKKRVDDAEKRIKEFLKVEKDKLLRVRADEVAAYFLAAWKLEAKRLEKPDTAANSVAREARLDPATLDRFDKYLTRKGGNNPLGDAWSRVQPKTAGTVNEDVEKAAREAQEFVVSLLTEVPKSGGNPGAQKTRAEVSKALFEDKGVFVVADNEIVSKMEPSRKQTFEAMKAESATLQKAMPPAPPIAHGLAEGNAAELNVAIRGNPSKPGEVAPRRFLRILTGADPAKFIHGSGRLELAEAIADPKNPLTARVMVNRIWQQHFGRGIVGTASNFGSLGERPTHPELLDYLTTRFIESNWSIKHLHRLILLSSTYQLSSMSDEKNQQIDADNRYLWRMTRQRLRVEEFRDALLAVSGRLELSFGGKTTDLDAESNTRRTVYGKVSRHELCSLLRLFDFPDANITSERRTETTVPQQQLFVLNSPFCVSQAKAFVARLQTEASDDSSRVRRAYLLAYGREATSREIDIGTRFLSESDSLEDQVKNKLTRRERYAQALLAANEFLYLD